MQESLKSGNIVQPKTNGRSTPGKRKHDFSILEGGKAESPMKKPKILKFRGGGQVPADFKGLLTEKNYSDSADVTQPTNTDLVW